VRAEEENVEKYLRKSTEQLMAAANDVLNEEE